MTRTYHKLVRDKIPNIIEDDGEQPITYIADDKEYRDRLLDKLDEELQEFKSTNDPEELADMLEVIYSISKFKGISEQELQKIRSKKAKERGVFDNRIILEKVIS